MILRIVLIAVAARKTPNLGGAGALFLPELGLQEALIDLGQMPEKNYSKQLLNNIL